MIYFIPIVDAHLSCCLATWPFSFTRKILIWAGRWAGGLGAGSTGPVNAGDVVEFDKVQHLRGMVLSSTHSGGFWGSPVVAGLR